ncbi:hypothetical protein CHLNCDRAFT_138475 [Chlorella variabilis]|uniref:BZIP domain-containing protein n=1 Tax=Chlorella variabilis TaxID=554065 RepID=E1ZN50_CHLVA|nr:hypothetical protein CHLNCDRAFT_138475 [Chlorella variabilis]EFN52810.1 hypothetical protein CHLNCDRAFT_138475 [Chlorella variabilis]|eukprot:XP_005844912.1 hypothetical protein CHLNCDRAFT_138475 [Chlorella variabilis]
MAAAPAPEDTWGELLLDGLPNVGLLDDLQLDCGLSDVGLPPGLHDLECLDLDDLGAAGGGAAPASSDLLESLQLDAFSHPASSSDARHSPSDSGSDSPVVLPLVGAAPAAPATGPRQGTPPRGADASPATSESETNGGGRSGSPAAATSQRGAQAGGAAAAQQPQRPLSEEEKRLARMQRNRENAQLSRQRKKQQMSELEARCGTLTQRNAQLAATVQRLTAENMQLRQQLVLVCQQAGRATGAAGAKPAAGAAAAAAAAQAGKVAGAAQAPATVAAAAAKGAQPAAGAAPAGVAPKGVIPQWPLLPFGFLPKVTFSVQQSGRPTGQPAAAAAAAAAAPAKPAQPAAAGAARAAPAAPAAARPPKRAKTAAAGASSALLALFTLFMFAGPLTPAPLAAPGASSASAAASIAAAAGAQRMLQALPESAAAPFLDGGEAAAGGGRRLQALPAAASEGQAPPRALPAGGGRLHQLLNSTLQALMEEPGNAALEAAALQRLQELGPVALLLDADGGAGAGPLAASAAFPRLAGQLFGGAGLEVPQMCHKVLEFDAASVPHAVRSRRSLERYVLGATGFRGRSLAAATADGGGGGAAAADPEPLRIEQPAAAGGEEGGGEEDGGGGGGTALLPRGGVAAGPVLVSVLLPANASGGVKLASVDKVFVVLLHPQDKYLTYSCPLPRPVFL